MPISDIILNKGEIIVVLSSSTLGIIGVDKGMNFGTVQKINALCDTVTVGATVQFDISKAENFMIISGVKFYKLNEKDISFSEPIAP